MQTALDVFGRFFGAGMIGNLLLFALLVQPVPPPAQVFADGFETGTPARWSAVTGYEPPAAAYVDMNRELRRDGSKPYLLDPGYCANWPLGTATHWYRHGELGTAAAVPIESTWTTLTPLRRQLECGTRR